MSQKLWQPYVHYSDNPERKNLPVICEAYGVAADASFVLGTLLRPVTQHNSSTRAQPLLPKAGFL